jgi:hypothetical protein
MPRLIGLLALLLVLVAHSSVLAAALLLPRPRTTSSTTSSSSCEQFPEVDKLSAGRWEKVQNAVLYNMLKSWFLFFAIPMVAHSTPSYYDLDLLNGRVQLEEAITLRVPNNQASGSLWTIQLIQPQLVGAGSGGAVFAFADAKLLSPSANKATFSIRDLLLKVSWATTSIAVQRECQTLQYLEKNQVGTTELCLGHFVYHPDDSSTGQERTMILVYPYMRDAVSSIDEVPTEAERRVAVDQIARTLVQMLMAHVITIDVQPLISKYTGQVLFIDMTEATILPSSPQESYSFLDQTLVSSFTNEMVALIPEPYWEVAQQSVKEELEQLKQKGVIVPVKIMSVLGDQTPFLSLD